jgi:NAD-dependent DNA ligase
MIDYKKLNKDELVALLKQSDNQYHNLGEPMFSDVEYDEVKDYLRKIDKNNEYFKHVGAEIIGKDKVKLPYFLGSQDKIKDDVKTLEKWVKKYNNPASYIISEKLDGISCLIVYGNANANANGNGNGNDNIKIYTRGDGKYGQDISHLKYKIKDLPKLLKTTSKIAVRGELIISKANWQKIAHKGTTARNVVAGFVNSKKADKEIADYIEYIVYDVIEPRTKLEDGLIFAKKHKFNVVKHIKINNLTISELYELYKEWKNESKYEIDGLVVTHNDLYKLKSGENPKYSFAFKSLAMHEEVRVIVKDVEWNVSKDKYLKPIVKFDEIKLNGVKIKQATGFNAEYISKNNIGVGSKIIIIRSGDVIPHIKEVLTPSTNKKPLLPDVPFIWNGKDIILDDDNKNREQDIKTYTHFMKSLNIKGIGEGVITKLYDNSYDTLIKIINITKTQLLKIDGFKDKSATNLLKALEEIKSKNCVELMTASNIFGRGMGEKKLNLIIDKYPYICNNQEKASNITLEDIKKINGMGEKSALLFITNLKEFYKFYNSLNIIPEVIVKVPKITNNTYKDNIYVFTGIRDKDLEKIIIASGGTIGSTITRKTTLLIIKNADDETTKVKKAREFNIPIITYDEFIK